jgi:hypothetical protein
MATRAQLVSREQILSSQGRKKCTEGRFPRGAPLSDLSDQYEFQFHNPVTMGHSKSKEKRQTPDKQFPATGGTVKTNDDHHAPPPASISKPKREHDQVKLNEIVPGAFYLAGALETYEQEALAQGATSFHHPFRFQRNLCATVAINEPTCPVSQRTTNFLLSTVPDALDASRHFTSLQVIERDTLYHEIMSSLLESDPESYFSNAVAQILSFVGPSLPDGVTIPSANEFKHLTGYLYPYNGKLANHCDNIPYAYSFIFLIYKLP